MSRWVVVAVIASCSREPAPSQQPPPSLAADASVALDTKAAVGPVVDAMVIDAAVAQAKLPSIPTTPPNPAALRASRALVKSGLAQVESWRQGPQDDAKIDAAVADLRRAIITEPANLDAWFRLGYVYGEFKRLDGATEIAVGLTNSACDACIGYIFNATTGHSCELNTIPLDDQRTWDFSTAELEKLASMIHGRTSALTAPAQAVMTFDAVKYKPFLGKTRVVLVTKNRSSKQLAGAAKVEAWFDYESRFAPVAKGTLTCDDKCCRLVCKGSESDLQPYLDRMCFAPGPELARMEWHTFMGGGP